MLVLDLMAGLGNSPSINYILFRLGFPGVGNIRYQNMVKDLMLLKVLSGAKEPFHKLELHMTSGDLIGAYAKLGSLKKAKCVGRNVHDVKNYVWKMLPNINMYDFLRDN